MIRCPKCKSMQTITIVAKHEKGKFYHELACINCRNKWITDKVD